MTELWVFLLIVLPFCLLGSRLEGWQWHGGHCSRCGSPWRYFDTDSQGGRGYKCGCGRCIWVSWPSVDVVKHG